MEVYIAEVFGTFILITLGAGVCANVALNKTGGNDSGYIIITWGWGIAVFIAVFMTGDISGAHLNPAVTVGLASAGNFDWSLVPGYIIAQLIGAFIGASCIWFQYRDHFAATEDPATKLGVFSTAPAIDNRFNNVFSEVFATFIFVLAILYIAAPDVGIGSLKALPVGLLVFGIGMSLGGTTGYAINPARDLGPRIAHALMPIEGKGPSNWGYAWVPVIGPITGAVFAAILYRLLPF